MAAPARGPPQQDHLFKLLLIGDSTVGKSCLIVRFAEDKWEPNFISTIGVDFKVRNIDCGDKRIKLQIWDTAGQERFNNITRSYYRGSDGILVVYDVTNRESFEHVTKWLGELQKNTSDDAVRFLVGNKCDLSSQQVVTEQMGRAVAEERGMEFMQTSAKTGHNVEEVFSAITKLCVQREASRTGGSGLADRPTPVVLPGLPAPTPGQKKPGCKC
eukprot:TRINITY_DN2222_c0_g2_i1.p1 TRINITY_DN2222_c0_g2~~TRINITY_DN2222_c0_g2_i1.p1  ORF type:complete len:215 (+),score=83.55 TRINITY_DN2222_c0_g2_i1:100-744(+)